MAFLDELAAGILPASTPELASAFGLSGAVAAVLTLVAPLALTTFIEAPFLLAADRARDRRGFVRAGLVALALGSLAVVCAPAAWVAAAALALYVPVFSVGLGAAQAALVEAAPGQAERLMIRWTLAAALGDLAAPALLAALALLGWGWRAAFAVVAVLALVHAAGVPRLPHAGATRVDDGASAPPPSTARALVQALRHRRLVAWTAGVLLCTLLDEIFVAFAALALEQRFAAGAAQRALVLGAFLGGGALGLVIIERLLHRVAGRPLLAWTAGLGALAYLGWVVAPSLAASAVLAGLTGLTTAGQYPLAKAQAYRAVPGQPGLVNALLAPLGPLELVLPLLLALITVHFGVTAALLVLAAQPLGLCALALWSRSEAPSLPG